MNWWAIILVGFTVWLLGGIWTILCVAFGSALKERSVQHQAAMEAAKWTLPQND